MENNKNFDQFFQKILKEDPSVPPSLEWENMAIETPKRKLHNMWYFALLMLIALSIPFCTYINSNTKTKHEEAMVLTPNPSQDQASTIIETTGIKPINKTTTSPTVSQPQRPTKTSNTTSTNIQLQNTETTKKPNQIQTEKEQLEQTTSSQSISYPAPENYLSIINKSKKSIVTTSNKLSLHSTLKKETVAILSIPMLSKGNNLLKYPTNKAILSQARWAENSNKKEHTSINERQQNSFSILAFAGTNSFNLQIEDESTLQNKLNTELGLSLSLGLEKPVKNNLFWYASLNYIELHTLFQHTRVLSKTYNLTADIVTTKLQHITHNNYYNQVSVTTGFGKFFPLGNKLNLQLSTGISAGKLISNTGKTLQNEAVIRLENIALNTPISFQISPSIGFNYAWKENLSLGVKFNINQSLNKSININIDTKTSFTQQLEFGLKYHIGQKADLH